MRNLYAFFNGKLYIFFQKISSHLLNFVFLFFRYLTSAFYSKDTKAVIHKLGEEIKKPNFEKVDESLYVTIDMVKDLALASNGLFQFVIFRPITDGWELLDAALGPSHSSENITSFNPTSQVKNL